MDTVLVELARPWFGPGGQRYRDEVGGVKYRHRLETSVAVQAPSDAKIYSLSGDFLGLRKDWSQSAEAASLQTAELRARVTEARKAAASAQASLAAAQADHKRQTTDAKKAETAEAVKKAEAAYAEAKKELDAAVAELDEASAPKE